MIMESIMMQTERVKAYLMMNKIFDKVVDINDEESKKDALEFINTCIAEYKDTIVDNFL